MNTLANEVIEEYREEIIKLRKALKEIAYCKGVLTQDHAYEFQQIAQTAITPVKEIYG